jgi:uncharacterized membrane protein
LDSVAVLTELDRLNAGLQRLREHVLGSSRGGGGGGGGGDAGAAAI